MRGKYRDAPIPCPMCGSIDDRRRMRLEYRDQETLIYANGAVHVVGGWMALVCEVCGYQAVADSGDEDSG